MRATSMARWSWKWFASRVSLAWARVYSTKRAGLVATPREIHTGPQGARLRHHHPNVLRRLLHLAGEVDGCGSDEIGVRAADFDPRVESFHVDLGRGHCLLTDIEALPEAVYF